MAWGRRSTLCPSASWGWILPVVRKSITFLKAGWRGCLRESVLNQNFFLTTGVCMNNFLVAQRFEDEAELDVTIDYVLTFRMRPTPVKLRLLKHPAVRLRYILVQR